MARIILTTRANDESSYTVIATITDEDGTSLVATTLAWSLKDSGGTTVNSRSAVTIDTPATANTITMSGDDISLGVNSDPKRILTLYGVYASNYGSALTLTAEAEFMIDDLIGIT